MMVDSYENRKQMKLMLKSRIEIRIRKNLEKLGFKYQVFRCDNSRKFFGEF